MRERLPNRRKCVTQRLKIDGQTVHFTIGMYADGRPGELFIDMHRIGTSVKMWCESTAKLISLMLQYGVPLSELVEALVGQGTEPFGRVPVSGHPMIVDASGVLDAVIRSLALDFLADECVEKPICIECIDSLIILTKDMDAAEIYGVAETIDRVEALDNFVAKFA